MIHTTRSAFHRLRLIRLTRATSVALIAIAAIRAITAFGVSVRAWFIKRPVASRPIPALAQWQLANEPLKIIQIALRSEGSKSAEITAPNGRYMFILLNRTGPKDFSLQHPEWVCRITSASDRVSSGDALASPTRFTA